MEDVRAEVQALVAQSGAERAAKTLSNWRAADVIEALDGLPTEAAVEILRHLPDEAAAKTWDWVGAARRSQALVPRHSPRLNLRRSQGRDALRRGKPAGGSNCYLIGFRSTTPPVLPKFGPVIILFRAFLLPMVSFAENVQENIDVYL